MWPIGRQAFDPEGFEKFIEVLKPWILNFPGFLKIPFSFSGSVKCEKQDPIFTTLLKY